MTDKEKRDVAFLYKYGFDPDDIAESFELDKTEVMEYCSGIL